MHILTRRVNPTRTTLAGPEPPASFFQGLLLLGTARRVIYSKFGDRQSAFEIPARTRHRFFKVSFFGALLTNYKLILVGIPDVYSPRFVVVEVVFE